MKIKKIFFTGLVLTVIILLIINIVRFTYRADLFRLNSVEITGNNVVGKAEILELSRLKKETPIFKINLREVNTNIMRNRIFRSVSVERILPNKILISVQERRTIANLYCGKLYQFREDNLITEIIEKDMALSLPVVTGMLKKDLVVNELTPESFKLNLVSNVLRELEKNDIREHIAQINIINELNLLLVTCNGVKLKVGINSREQIAKLKKIIPLLYDKDKPDYIDLRFAKMVLVSGYNPNKK